MGKRRGVDVERTADVFGHERAQLDPEESGVALGRFGHGPNATETSCIETSRVR